MLPYPVSAYPPALPPKMAAFPADAAPQGLSYTAPTPAPSGPSPSYIDASGAKVFQPPILSPAAIRLRNRPDAIRRFVVLGDAGTGEQPQYDIATAMGRTFAEKPFASALILGDNVYPNGEPDKFDQCIGRPYQPLRDAGVRFYPVLGNHDVHLSPGDAQLRYWSVPRFYSKRIGNVEIFALDTTLFFPGYGKHGYVPDPNVTVKMAARELDWLNKALAASTARFKIVYGHYPLYSVTERSEPPGMRAQLRGLLEPLMARYGVDAYLAGHDHDYEKTRRLPDGVQHFVSGAAGRLNKVGTDGPLEPPMEKVITQRHFMLFEERPEGLTYQVVSGEGQVLDGGLIPAKQRFPAANPEPGRGALIPGGLIPATHWFPAVAPAA
jgi:hypothetical protein